MAMKDVPVGTETERICYLKSEGATDEETEFVAQSVMEIGAAGRQRHGAAGSSLVYAGF